MYDGYIDKRNYDEMIHLETIRLIRYVGHTVYMGIPTRKGYKKVNITKYYPLPKDRKEAKLTKEEMAEFFNQKEPVMSNGKLRGYMVRGKFEKLE